MIITTFFHREAWLYSLLTWCILWFRSKLTIGVIWLKFIAPIIAHLKRSVDWTMVCVWGKIVVFFWAGAPGLPAISSLGDKIESEEEAACAVSFICLNGTFNFNYSWLMPDPREPPSYCVSAECAAFIDAEEFELSDELPHKLADIENVTVPLRLFLSDAQAK